MTDHPKCPVCTKNDICIFLKYAKANIYECKYCSVRFLFPLPTKKQLIKFYEKGYFEGGKLGAGGYRDYLGLEASLKHEALKKIKYLKENVKQGKLLDVGAGTGVFAELAMKAGFDVSANDISRFASEILKKRNITTYTGPINTKVLPKNKFEIITAWDVVEHMVDVNEMLLTINYSLKKDGYFFLTTPDTGSWDAKLMGKKWYGYKKLPEHVIFLNHKSISLLFAKHGFEVVEIRSWGFYRNLGFVTDRLKSYGSRFLILEKIINWLNIGHLSLFFPMTDFIVVGKKVK